MLYPTHRRLGIQFGEGLAVIAISSGLFSALSFKSLPLILLGMGLAISGSLFGAEYPDIDSPKSIPAQRHPIWRMIFQFFHVHHRGKFSHSILSQTLLWGIIWIGMLFFVQDPIIAGHINNNLIVKIFLVVALGNLFEIMVNFISAIKNSSAIKNGQYLTLIKFLATDSKEAASDIHFHRTPMTFTTKIISYLISAGFVFLLIPNQTSYLIRFCSIYILGIYCGVLSHLFGDIATVSGIHIGWGESVKPVRVMQKIPILNLMIGKGTAGSPYENRFRIIVSIIDFILFIMLFFVLLKI